MSYAAPIETFDTRRSASVPDTNSIGIHVWIATVLAALLVGIVYILLGGSFSATIAVVGSVAILFLSLAQPTVSFYLLVTLGLVVEQFPLPQSITAGIGYHTNLNNQFYWLSWLPVNPFEIHLGLIIIGTLVRSLLEKNEKPYYLAATPLKLYAVCIVFGVFLGLRNGGSFLGALWEVRGIMYMIVLALLVPKLIRTDRQVRTLIWIIVLCLASRAIEVSNLYRRAGWEIWFGGWGNHEDPGFLAAALVFATALLFFKGNRTLTNVLLVLALPFVIAMIASDRRTVYAVWGAGLVVFFLMLPRESQLRFMRPAWKVGVAFVIYLALFWNSQGVIGSPARSIRESFDTQPRFDSESYASSLYRKVEDFNLSQMVRNRPLLGAGYGTKLDFFMPIPITFSLGFITPHNQILGVIVKTGIIGFILFMFFYISALSEISVTMRDIKNPYLKAVLVFVAAAIVNHLVYSFFDIQLIYYRNNIFLGTLLGVASTIIGMHRHHKLSTAKVETGPRGKLDWLFDPGPERVLVS